MKQSPRYNNKMFTLLSMTTRFMSSLYVELVMAREVYEAAGGVAREACRCFS